MTDVDVVIAGYGPVGAVAANLLGRRGLRTLVVEPTTSVYHLPRAAHHDAEIHRVYESIGILDDLRDSLAANRGMDFITAGGKRLFGFVAAPGSSWMFYQPDLERALRAGVDRLSSVEVRLSHEVRGFTDHGDHVEVDVSGTTVTSRWLLGCDGARSTVRKGLDVDLFDYGFDQPWLVVDTVQRRPLDLPTICQQICDPARPATFIPMAGDHRRWEVMLLPGDDPETMPSRVDELLARWVQPGDVEVLRAVVYTFHALVADRWRVGNVLLAGDAAHQMPPFLGQGMCSGIRDAVNLAWKLDLVHRGLADSALLDTYQTEREPHVRQIIETAVMLGDLLQTTDADVAAARDADLLARPSHDAPAPHPLPGLGDGVLGSGARAGRLGATVGRWTLVTPAPIEHPLLDALDVEVIVGDDEVLTRPDGYVFGEGDARTLLDTLGSYVAVGSGRPRSTIVSAGPQQSRSG